MVCVCGRFKTNSVFIPHVVIMIIILISLFGGCVDTFLNPICSCCLVGAVCVELLIPFYIYISYFIIHCSDIGNL
jgi:hypothetical protein